MRFSKSRRFTAATCTGWKRRYKPLIMCGEMLQMFLFCAVTEGLDQHNKTVTSCWAIDLAAAMSFTVPFCRKNWLQTGHHVDAHAGNSMCFPCTGVTKMMMPSDKGTGPVLVYLDRAACIAFLMYPPLSSYLSASRLMSTSSVRWILSGSWRRHICCRWVWSGRLNSKVMVMRLCMASSRS